MSIAGLILAGGRAQRLGGGDKPLTLLGGRPILERLVAVLAPQVSALAVSANGDPGRFAGFGLPVLADPLPDYPGPLAGLLAGLEWASKLTGVKVLLSVAGDTPFLPADLGAHLSQAVEAGAPAAIACSGGRRHPVIGLWSISLAGELRRFLVEEGERKAGLWAERAGAVTVEWPDQPFDPFFNINRPGDLDLAQQMMEQWNGAAGGGKRTDHA
jgi:molybdopterin-guanine dinucleotide biosynthesis protein A